MFAGVRRLPRLACALAQRRHYLGAVLQGGDGTNRIALKLSAPWSKTTLAKPFDGVVPPMLGVLSPSVSCHKHSSRVIIKLFEENMEIASVELSPKPIGSEHNAEDDQEKQVQVPDANEWNDTDDEEDMYSSMEEGDSIYSSMEESETSGDTLMDLFYMGGEAKTTTESMELIPLRKSSESDTSSTRLSSSFVMDLCVWPHNFIANATIQYKDGKGDCAWKSTWVFNLEIDSTQSDPNDIRALSQYPAQHLEYTGAISSLILEEFQVSFDTHYEAKEILGSGGEGQVYRCSSLDKSHSCAVKWWGNRHIIIEEPRESLIGKKLFHPNIKRIFCAWKENKGETDLAEDSFFLAHELCKCTLEDYLDDKTMKSIDDRVKVFVEVVSGVNYLHSEGIVHRDIKPSNIFLDDQGHVKIGDFGQSASISSNSCSYGGKLYGTKLYGSPEILKKQRHGVKSDIFSLGMVYAELLGPSAIAAERREWLLDLRKLIQTRHWKRNPLSSWEKSELSRDWTGDAYLMIKMLAPSPEQRPSCANILEVL